MNDTQRAIHHKFSSMAADMVACSPFFDVWKIGRITKREAIEFLLAFDPFVASFPPLIALACARVGERERAVLAENLYQECGSGDLTRTHYRIYRKYVNTAGIEIESTTVPGFAKTWRDNYWNYLLEAPRPAYVLGVIAASEYLAQPTLYPVFEAIRPLFPRADIEYFTTHLALETEHVEELSNILGDHPYDEVFSGFRFGQELWSTWFNGLYHHIFASGERDLRA